jgi:ribonuclease D
MPAPILTTTAAVVAFATELARFPTIAVDLEADSLHCYQEKVCLLQFTTPERTVLVDPLAGPDLAPLAPVLADPGVRKLFHAADYDIRCLHRDFGIAIRGLFDTMIACQFLGEAKVGLADVLGKYFGVELDKQYQRADWAVRPLSAAMVRYAAEDTRHLHRLAELLEAKLEAKGRLDWVAEEFTLLEQGRFSDRDGPFFLRSKGAGTLRPRQLAVLEELLQWRDAEARRRDCPLFKVVGNKQLLDLAQAQPRTPQGVAAIEGISPRQADRYGKDLLGAIETGLALPEHQLPVFPRGERRLREPEVEARLAVLKQWRQEQAAALEIDPGVLINNALLEELARRRPEREAELAELPGLKNWQRLTFGAELIARLRSAG